MALSTQTPSTRATSTYGRVQMVLSMSGVMDGCRAREIAVDAQIYHPVMEVHRVRFFVIGKVCLRSLRTCGSPTLSVGEPQRGGFMRTTILRGKWLSNALCGLAGGILASIFTFIIVSFLAGFYSFLRKYSISDFYINFVNYLSLSISVSPYEVILCLIFGGIAAIWGYNRQESSSSSQVVFYFYMAASGLIFLSRKIVATATIPRRFASEPDVAHDLLILNVLFNIFYAFAFCFSMFIIYKLFENYKKYIGNYLGDNYEKN